MGECEAKCKELWWPLGLWKCYINAVHLPFKIDLGTLLGLSYWSPPSQGIFLPSPLTLSYTRSAA